MDYDKHRTSFVLNVLRKSETLKGDKIIEANLKRMEEIQDMDEIVVVGSDVYALYPSLNDIEVAIICYNTILNSDIRFLNFNYWVASKYKFNNGIDLHGLIDFFYYHHSSNSDLTGR